MLVLALAFGCFSPMLTAQTITESPVPTAGGIPQDIAAGPDGNLWFTEGGNRIGRITTAGVVTGFKTCP